MNTKTKTKSFKFLESLAAWEILLFSGGEASGLRFFTKIFTRHPLRIMLFVTGLLIAYMHSRKRTIFKVNSSLAMMYYISAYVLLHLFFFSFFEGLEAFSVNMNYDSPYFHMIFDNFSEILVAVGMYFIISFVSFKSFREVLLKNLTILSAATLIAHLLRNTLGIGTYGKNASTFYIFMDWGGRMASVYWEPGQYQIIMIFVLVLFMDELKAINLANIKYYVKKFGIIILAIIVCRSTMGYMCLMAVIGIAFMFNKSAKKHKILYLLLLLIASGFIFLIWNSDVVQKKIDPKNLLNHSTSYYGRRMDNLAVLETSMISPLTGMGDLKERGRISNHLGNTTASNGWLNIAARYGWPMLIILCLCIIKNIERMNFAIPALIVFIPLFMSQSNEHYALYPIAYIYI